MSLQHALLGFLNYQPMTGYELKQFMDVSTSNFWHAKQSQIYTTLKKMEEKELVISEVEEQDGRPNRRVYTITESGQANLQTWLDQPVMELQPKKELMLLKLFFSARKDKDSILTQLRIQRDLHQNQLTLFEEEIASVIQQFAKMMPETANDALLWDTTRRYGALFSKVTIQWLDETIDRIDKNF